MDLEKVLATCQVDPDTAKKFAPPIEAAFFRFKIDGLDNQARFLANVLHESGRFRYLEENLNYSVEALLATFGRHRISEADARAFGRMPARPANQEAIANAVYGGIWGAKNLGNTEPGDGWRYRGRGLMQITGRENYASAARNLGQPYIDQPDLVALPEDAVMTAAWFWSKLGVLNESFADTVQRVNGGQNGHGDRLMLYHQLFRAMS